MKPWNYSQHLVGFLLAVGFTSGALPSPGHAQPVTDPLQATYRAAIQDAAFVEPEKDVDTLIPITPDNPLLIWNPSLDGTGLYL